MEESYPLLEFAFFFVGMVLAGVASFGRLWCTVYIAGRKTGTLVNEGPFSLCRNPLYFFSLLGGIGVGLTTETITIPILIIFLFLFWYPGVIRNEEARLLEVHGPEYRDYCARVSRFIPRLSTFTEPENYDVNVQKFRKDIFDALWFIWIIGILEVAEGLREIDILPTLLTLP